jgi:hypothetical protein
LANAAAAGIRQLSTDDAFSIEQHLREELQAATSWHLKQQYIAVPFYLQQLLGEVSIHYATNPDRYAQLLSEVFRVDEVLFITLNYDSLLETALSAYPQGIDRLEAYCDAGRPWSLVKLHGSVDWRYEMEDPEAAPSLGKLIEGIARGARVPSDGRIAYYPFNGSAVPLWTGGPGGELYTYPALAAPLGAGDEIVCPPDHVHYAVAWLGARPRLNLLVIGYSGLDQRVLDLLASTGKQLNHVRIVNRNGGMAESLLKALGQRTGSSLIPSVHVRVQDFADYVFDPDLRGFINQVRSGADAAL